MTYVMSDSIIISNSNFKFKFKPKYVFFLNLKNINPGGHITTPASVKILTEAGTPIAPASVKY
jgi:hypothetical protein